MNNRHRRSGAALILVLWAIAVLSLMTGGIAFAIRQNLAVCNLQKDRLTAHVLARAGVEQSLATLTDDFAGIDTLDEYWSDDPQTLQEIALSGGTFSVINGSDDPVPTRLYGAGDESSKLNVNVATREQLLKLQDMTDPIAGAIIDWRDRDEDPQPDGIERSHYSSLAHPYEIRNGPLRTVRELLCVRDVTPDLFYGEDTNANGLLDPNENDGSASPPDDNADGRLDRGWFAYLTVYSYEKNVDQMGNKRVNITNADAGTLSQKLGLENWAAQSIVKARENKKFEHLVDLLDVKRDSSVSKDANSDMNFRENNEQDQPVTLGIFKKILDKITLKDDQMLLGRVNINTASQQVLEAIPGLDKEKALAIVHGREGGGSYASIADLLDVSGIDKEAFGKLESMVTVRSSVFRIVSEGRSSSGLALATIECVVDRASEVPRVLYWLESSP